MKRAAFKNSILIAGFVLFACIFIMPVKSIAMDSSTAVLDGRLNGYIYSFNVDPNYKQDKLHNSDSIAIKVYNEVNVDIIPSANTITVDESDIIIKEGVATVDLEPYCNRLFEMGSTVYCSVCYRYLGTEYNDFIVFEKLEVVEKVNNAPTENTTVEYTVDSVATLDLEDFDIEAALDASNGNEYIADYLLNKDAILTESSEGSEAIIWVDNTVDIEKGCKESKDSIVLAFKTSSLLKDYKSDIATPSVAGFYTRFNITEAVSALENFFCGLYTNDSETAVTQFKESVDDLVDSIKNADSTYAEDIMRLISSIPMGVNIKEASSGKYSLSNATYGLVNTLIIDVISGRMIYLPTYIKNTFFEQRGDDIVLCLSKFTSCVSFWSFDNDPSQYIDAVNGLFRNIIENIDAAVSSDETLSSYGLKGIRDVAEVLDYKGEYSLLERLKIKAAFISLIPDTAMEAVESFALNNVITKADSLTFSHVVISHRDVPYPGSGIDSGDNNNIWLWVGLLVAAVAAIVAAVIIKKRRS